MKTGCTACTVTIGLLLLAFAGVLKGSAQGFGFTKVDVPGALSTHLGGVANNGEVVGFYFDQAGTAHSFLRSPDGSMTFPIDCANSANACPNVAGTFLNRIDSQGGTLAGYWLDSAGVQRGLVISRATNAQTSVEFPLPTPGAQFTLLNGINRSGEIS